MLKLEKAAKSRELNVILRDKPSLFSRSFLKAMSYALLFHLLAVLLFTVSPFKITYEASILPPVQVATDFLSQHIFQHVTTHFEERSQVPAYLIEPRRIPSQLPEMASSLALHKDAVIDSRPPLRSENLFSALEARIESPPLSHPTNASLLPLIVKSSGGISEGTLAMDNDVEGLLIQFAKEHPLLLSPTRYHLAFSVQVDQRTGRIFWWEMMEDDSDNRLKDLAFTILKKLHFSIDHSRLIESGHVELSMLLRMDK